MDASESLPQPTPAAPSTPARPSIDSLEARSALSLADYFCHALSEGGAFDRLQGEQAGRYEAGMSAIESGNPATRRIGYDLLLQIASAQPERMAHAANSLRARLLNFDAHQTAAPPPTPAPLATLDVLLVSPRIAHTADLLVGPPVTRWIEGTLYIGATRDRLYRVIRTHADPDFGRVWLTTADHELWLVTLDELTTHPA